MILCKMEAPNRNKDLDFKREAHNWTAAGIHIMNAGNPDLATAAFMLAIQNVPDYAEAHCGLGIAFFKLGKVEVAESSLRKSVQLNQTLGPAWFHLGILLRSEERNKEALNAFSKAAINHIDEGYLPISSQNIREILTELGRFEEAEEAFRTTTQLKPDLAQAWDWSGYIMTIKGDYTQAIEMYYKAVEFDSSMTSTWQNLGRLLQEMGRIDEAQNAFDKASN
jgi:tetratricopeptide (TPR) repeat protein